MIQIVNDRYQIRRLYKFDPPITDNFHVAFKKLENMISKMKNNLKFFQRMIMYFVNLLQQKQIEKSSLQKDDFPVHYECICLIKA